MPQTTIQVRVPFVDVDSSDRIHYTAMLRYMEVAEHALMRQLGIPYATTLREWAFPRVHVECDFRGAILFDDVLEIVARVGRVGTSSWTVEFTAYPAAPERERVALAEGKMTIVAMDPATERAMPLPDVVRRVLTGEASEE